MRVVARSTLHAYLQNVVDPRHRSAVAIQLGAWFAIVSRAKWKTSAELKAEVGSASILSANRVVFNIKGNDYRLTVQINYAYQVLRIVWLGSHAEYDNIDAREVEYEKQLYFR